MKTRKVAFDFLRILTVSVVVLLPQLYLAITQVNLDWMAFLFAVIFPILVGAGIFWFGKKRILFFAMLAYIWSVTDDAPVYLDSVATWPEVTSGFQHVFLEILLHLLTLFFMILTIREALKKIAPTRSKILKVSIFTSIAFILSYAQNIPLSAIQEIVAQNWYALDFFEHLASFAFLYLAIRESKRGSPVRQV